jgi:hypothetical protein
VFFLLGGSLAPQWRVAQEIEVAAVIRLQDLLLIERGVAASRRLTGDPRASRELLVAHEKIGAAIPHGHDTFLAGQGVLGRTWIDGNRCERGIEALRQYRREYDDRLKDWKRNPLHDWTSHGADALRTFACGFDDGPIRSHDPHWRGRQGERPPRGTHWSA